MTIDEAKASLQALCHTCKHFPTCINDKPECFQAIEMAIKALEQQHCDDCISRQAAIDTIESWLICDDYNEAERHIMRAMQSVLYDLPSVKPQEPCDDCISRQAVLDIIIPYCQDDDGSVENTDDLRNALDDIESLPPVTPKEKTGWIPVSERLPEPNTLVLCYVTTGATETYFLALWNDIQNAWEEGIGGYRFLEHDLEYEVIAWMPLPEPYKAESEVNE